jgi:hypothetical protein
MAKREVRLSEEVRCMFTNLKDWNKITPKDVSRQSKRSLKPTRDRERFNKRNATKKRKTIPERAEII